MTIDGHDYERASMKVLILSCNTGEGHNSAGKALLEQFLKMGVKCEMKDALLFASSKVSRRASKIYVWSTVAFPSLFKGAYRAGKLISSAKGKSPVYLANMSYAGKLYEYICRNGFDTVVMPHLFPAEAMTFIKKKYSPDILTYDVSTDYTCIPFVEETDLDYYFIPHEDLSGEFIEKGISKEKLIVSGIPVASRFSGKIDRDSARKLLDIPKDISLVLIMTGSMGYGDVETTLNGLRKRMGEKTWIYIFCGNNVKIKEQLARVSAKDSRIRPLEFTDKVDVYMDAADLLFTKPGGLTSTEAAVKMLPIVHTKPIPGCEEKNAEFFQEHGIALSNTNGDALVSEGIELLYDASIKARMIENQARTINSHAAEDICLQILRHGRKRLCL